MVGHEILKRFLLPHTSKGDKAFTQREDSFLGVGAGAHDSGKQLKRVKRTEVAEGSNGLSKHYLLL